VKRGAELSTDHHLVVSWIRWRGRLPDRPGKPKRVVRVNCERLLEASVRGVLPPKPKASPVGFLFFPFLWVLEVDSHVHLPVTVPQQVLMEHSDPPCPFPWSDLEY